MPWLCRGFLGGLLLLLLLSVAPTAHAAIKVIVVVHRPFFAMADPQNTPDNSGTLICLSLELRPWTQDARRVLECAIRANVVASTACAAVKTLAINRVQTEYSVSVLAEEVMVWGCPE